MLSDRQYMRDRDPRESVSVLTWVILLIIGGFVVELVCLSSVGTPAAGRFVRELELTPESLRAGHVWTLLTYALLHDPDSLFHILGSLLGIFFFGRAVLPLLGERRFAWFCLGAVLAGGLAWAAANWSDPGASVIGASALASALLILFACFNPDQPITFLLFFVLPVTVRPRYLAYFVVALDGFGFLFYELAHHPSPFGIAHSAHLGGMLAAWIYYRYLHEPALGRASIELPQWLRKRRPAAPPLVTKVNLSRPDDLRAEVDRILDKINSDGFGALTPDEKRVLDEAKNLLSRR